MPNSWSILGPSYIDADTAAQLRPLIEDYYINQKKTNYYWEDIWNENLNRISIHANCVDTGTVVEMDTLEELRLFDNSYVFDSRCSIIKDISAALGVKESDIRNCCPLQGKDGFSFTSKSKKYALLFTEANAAICSIKAGSIIEI